jgi:hypothetical protein
MKLRKLHLYVIESTADDSEAAVLQQLARSRISVTTRRVADKKAFVSAVQAAIIHFKANRAYFPVLHISAHGCDEGIWLSNREFLPWDEFGTAVGTDLSDRLILCMSACEGLRSWRMALMESAPHYLMLIGTEKKPGWSDTKAGFPVFYRSLAHGKPLDQALDDLKASSGHLDFIVVPGPQVRELRREVTSVKTIEEAHAVRDKYRLPSLRHIEFSPVYPFRPVKQVAGSG